MPKEVDFSNENEVVALVACLNGGGHFCVRTILKSARESMEQWKRFYLYFSEVPENRHKLDKPFIIYHFLDEFNKSTASVAFSHVQSMQIAPIPDDAESWKGGAH